MGQRQGDGTGTARSFAQRECLLRSSAASLPFGVGFSLAATHSFRIQPATCAKGPERDPFIYSLGARRRGRRENSVTLKRGVYGLGASARATFAGRGHGVGDSSSQSASEDFACLTRDLNDVQAIGKKKKLK